MDDNRRSAAERLAERWGTKAELVLDTPYVLVGSVGQIVEELLECRERWEISYEVVFERDRDAFAPVVARLAGR